jgi:hypothetical protein
MLDFYRLRIDPGDGYPVMDYRIHNDCVESRVVEMDTDTELEIDSAWSQLSPEELSSHVMADTVVARWLRRRLGVFPLVRACHQDRCENGTDVNNNETQVQPPHMAA